VAAVPTLGACLLFAFADAVQARLQGTDAALRRRGCRFSSSRRCRTSDGVAAGRLRRARGRAGRIGVPYVKER
jgi:hypothetical protein